LDALADSLLFPKLDPPQLWFVLQTPIRLVQLLTDPVVDGFAIIFARVVSPMLMAITRTVLEASLVLFFGGVHYFFGEQAADKLSRRFIIAVRKHVPLPFF
jgi:hypothetical protein